MKKIELEKLYKQKKDELEEFRSNYGSKYQ